MLIVHIDEAQAGMKLAAPVAHPENAEQQLLRQGYVLEPPVILRMRDIGIEFIYVDYPGLDSLDKHIAVYLSPARQAIYRQIKDSMAQAQRQTRPGISYDTYCSSTRELVSVLMTQGQNPIYLDQMSRQGSDAVAHAAAVAHLALLLGLKLEDYLIAQRSRLPPYRAKDIVNLGVAAMLHDLGITRLPEALQEYSETEPPEDDNARAEWQSHAELGYELIRNDVEATAAAAVYQHHQHYDGSGFPVVSRGPERTISMEGEKIHVFSRIIFCANLYDRLATPMGRGSRRSNLEVLRLLQTSYASWCDPAIFRVLQALVPPFPPGTRVKLTDGSAAMVMDVSSGSPMKPMVQRLATDNWTLVGEQLDLREPDVPQIRVPAAIEPVAA